MIKIWGTSFSLIGDLIMSLPQLSYYKSKYKNIYVNFVIHKIVLVYGYWTTISSSRYANSFPGTISLTKSLKITFQKYFYFLLDLV